MREIISKEDASIKSESLLHRESIQEILIIQAENIDMERVQIWAKQVYQRRKVVKVEREDISGETREIYLQMEFLPLPPVAFTLQRHDPPPKYYPLRIRAHREVRNWLLSST